MRSHRFKTHIWHDLAKCQWFVFASLQCYRSSNNLIRIFFQCLYACCIPSAKAKAQDLWSSPKIDRPPRLHGFRGNRWDKEMDELRNSMLLSFGVVCWGMTEIGPIAGTWLFWTMVDSIGKVYNFEKLASTTRILTKLSSRQLPCPGIQDPTWWAWWVESNSNVERIVFCFHFVSSLSVE